MANIPYYQQKDIENIKKLREMMKALPPFCTEFFRGIEPRTSTRTRIAYAYDLSVFFDFLKKENPVPKWNEWILNWNSWTRSR